MTLPTRNLLAFRTGNKRLGFKWEIPQLRKRPENSSKVSRTLIQKQGACLFKEFLQMRTRYTLVGNNLPCHGFHSLTSKVSHVY